MIEDEYFIHVLDVLLDWKGPDPKSILSIFTGVPTRILSDHFNTAIQLYHHRHHIYIELLKQINNNELIQEIAQYNNQAFYFRSINEGLFSEEIAFQNRFCSDNDPALLDLFQKFHPERGEEIQEMSYCKETPFQQRLKIYSHEPIYSLIEEDDVDGLKEFISAPSFNENNICSIRLTFFRLSPGQYAAYCGSIRCFKFLYLNDLLFEVPYAEESFSIFHAAIVGGNYEIIRVLEETFPSDASFSGSLCIAALYHRHDIYNWLLEKCPNDSFQSLSVIHWASEGGNLSLLLEMDNINQNARYEESPLFYSCMHGHRLASQILIEKGVDVNSQDEEVTPLYYAALSSVRLVEYLLQMGAKLTYPQDVYFSAFVSAFHSKILDLLFPLVDFTQLTDLGYPGCCQWFFNQNPKYLRRCFESGFDANFHFSNFHRFPLIYHMVIKNFREGVKLCLEFGGDIRQIPYFENRRLILMKEFLFSEYQQRGMGYYDIFTLGLNFKKYQDDLQGQDINFSGYDGNTALSLSITKGSLMPDIVEILLKRGADPNQPIKSGLYPIHLAAMKSSGSIIQLLMNYMADPNVPTPTGQTPLHLISCENRQTFFRLAQILVKSGGNPFLPNPPGPCPYLLAKSSYEQKCLTPPKQPINRNGVFLPRFKIPKEFTKHPKSKQIPPKHNKTKGTYHRY